MKKEEYREASLEEIKEKMLKMLKAIDTVCRRHNINYWLSDGTLLGARRHKGYIPWDDDVDISMMRCDYNKFIEIAQKELGGDYFLQNRKTDIYYNNLVVSTKVRDNKSLVIEIDEDEEAYNQGAFVDIFVMNQFDSSDKKYRMKKFFYRMKSIAKNHVYEYEPCNKKILKSVLSMIFIWESKTRLIRTISQENDRHVQSGDSIGHDYFTPTSNKYRFNYNDIFPLRNIEFEGGSFLAPNNVNKVLENIYGDYMKLPPKKQRITHSIYYGIKKEIVSEE